MYIKAVVMHHKAFFFVPDGGNGERERVRERERESVRDERGVHSYNSCACSKKCKQQQQD
jgi:hypothetical protein